MNTGSELLNLAVENGIELLAITDHDTAAGYRQCLGQSPDIKLVSGVEFSCVWKNISIHIIGLGFDSSSRVIEAAEARQRQARELRGFEIGEKLAKKGIAGAYQGALSYCDQQAGRVGRPHFAQYLVDQGLVASRKKAFDRWLGAGKCGDVKNVWPSLEEAVGWITEGGGVAVVAHPLKYKMTNTKLKSLLSDFVTCGGRGIEVIGAGQSDDQTRYLARLCNEFSLLASGGSDFHGADMPWRKLGEIAPIPRSCQPVWEAL